MKKMMVGSLFFSNCIQKMKLNTKMIIAVTNEKRKKELVKQFDLNKEEAKRIKTSVELSGNPRCIMIYATIDDASEIDKARWDGLEGKIRIRRRK